jgi:quercetin dioxygenase-like cupin family protein
MATVDHRHITAADAPRFVQDGFAMVGIPAPSRDCAAVSAWRLTAAPGAESPTRSLTSDEVFVALGGVLEATLGGETIAIGPGDALIVSPGIDFSLANRCDEPFEGLVCLVAGDQAQMPWAA